MAKLDALGKSLPLPPPALTREELQRRAAWLDEADGLRESIERLEAELQELREQAEALEAKALGGSQ